MECKLRGHGALACRSHAPCGPRVGPLHMHIKPCARLVCQVTTAPSSGESPEEVSLVEMAARVREEEEAARARREELELQIMRLRHTAAVKRQASMLNQGSKGIGIGGSIPIGSSETGSSSSSADSATPIVPVRRKVLRKSKRMAAMAAGAGLLRVSSIPSSTGADTSTGASVAPYGGQAHEDADGRTQGTGIDMFDSGASMAEGPAGTLLEGGFGASGLEGSAPSFLAAQLGSAVQLKNMQNANGTAGASMEDQMCVVPKPIFIVSDCTGESAARTVRAALNQFELCFKTRAPATLIVFRFVEDEKKAYKIIETAAREDALVVYTLVNPASLKAVQTACKLHNVRSVDLWGNLLDGMEAHLDAVRSGVPMSSGNRRPVLTEDYFRMIEAVEYTRKMDDGALPREWKHADLLILGVSRCGKTPLSIFLGQRGYKVANLPLVQGVPVPKELFEIDQDRIVGLIIDPGVLMSIRRNRLGMMGVKDVGMSIDYAELAKINSELMYAKQLYAKNPQWPVLDVTLRGVEETAARILKILNDKRGDASPQWVEEMYGKMARRGAGIGSGSDSEGGVTPPAVPLRPLRMAGEQIYAMGEQYLVEGLY